MRIPDSLVKLKKGNVYCIVTLQHLTVSKLHSYGILNRILTHEEVLKYWMRCEVKKDFWFEGK